MKRRAVLLLLAAAPLTSARAADPWLRHGPAIPRASLLDQDGNLVRLDRLVRDRAVVLSFFFTGCSTVCPTQTAALRDLQEALSHRSGEAPVPLLISVSVDPLGDTPAAIRHYAERFELSLGAERGWVMLTGEEPELAKIWRTFEAGPPGAADHSTLLWVGLPSQGRWIRRSAFAPPAELAELVREASR